MGKATAENKSPSTAPHPPYFEMIAEAITALKERNGSSQPAIAKLIEDKHSKVLPPNFRKLLSIQLKKLVKSDKLYKVKNSYKISTETVSKQKKTKPLSRVKTPEALKKKAPTKKKDAAVGKVKRLSQVKTPEALKNKKPNFTTKSSRPTRNSNK